MRAVSDGLERVPQILSYLTRSTAAQGYGAPLRLARDEWKTFASLPKHRVSTRGATHPGLRATRCTPCVPRRDLPAFRSDRRDRPDPVQHVPRPRRAHRAPRPLPARPGCSRADACVGRKVRGARADRGACGGIRGHPTERPGWPNASLPPSALLRVRAGPPMLVAMWVGALVLIGEAIPYAKAWEPVPIAIAILGAAVPWATVGSIVC